MPPKRDTPAGQSNSRESQSAEAWKRTLSSAGRDVAARWVAPCRAMFDALAKQNPDDLAALVRSRTLQPEDMTFAAEKLGETNAPDAIEILKALVLDESTSSVVKEGALYGLYHLEASDLGDVLIAISRSSSPALRSVATRLLNRLG